MRIVQLLLLTVLGVLGTAVNGADGRLKKDGKRTLVSAGSPDPMQRQRHLQEGGSEVIALQEEPVLEDCIVENLEWIGDGMCDHGLGAYNTKACGWDGGDCCFCSCQDLDGNACPIDDSKCQDPDSQTCALCEDSVCEGTDLPFLVNGGDPCLGATCTAQECCVADLAEAPQETGLALGINHG